MWFNTSSRFLSLLFALTLAASCKDSKPSPPRYTVSFESEGGSVVDSLTVEKGKTISQLKKPVWENHTFVGWYASETDAQPFDFIRTSIEGPLTLYARWTDNATGATLYKVRFELGGGTAGGGRQCRPPASGRRTNGHATQPRPYAAELCLL